MVIHWFVGCMMNERELSVVLSGGYFDGKCGSHKERIWLTYLDVIHLCEECDNFVPLVSRYCSGIGQYRVGDYYLDGFRELPECCREFYEFYGCYYHGCDVCYTGRLRVVRCKSREQGYVTIDKVRIDTFAHERMIQSLAKFDCNKDKRITLLEHEFNERFEEFKLVLGEEAIDSLPDRLNPRNAVKGG